MNRTAARARQMQVGVPGQAPVRRTREAVQGDVRQVGEGSTDQGVAERRDPRRVVGLLPYGDLDRGSETGDRRDAVSARSDAPFLSSAVERRVEREIAADEECSDTLRPAQLVPGEGQRVDAAPLEVHGHLAHGPDGVRVDRNAVRVGDLDDLLDRRQVA
jgi:hypothetical protein